MKLNQRLQKTMHILTILSMMFVLSNFVSADNYYNNHTWDGANETYLIYSNTYKWVVNVSGTNLTYVAIGGNQMGHNASCDDYDPQASTDSTGEGYCYIGTPQSINASIYDDCTHMAATLEIRNFNSSNISDGTTFTNTTEIKLNTTLPCIESSDTDFTVSSATGYSMVVDLSTQFDKITFESNATNTEYGSSYNVTFAQVILTDSNKGNIVVWLPRIAFNTSHYYGPYGYTLNDADTVTIEQKQFLNQSTSGIESIIPATDIQNVGLVIFGLAMGGAAAILYNNRKLGQKPQS